VVDESAELAGWRIIREMVKHIWPREHPKLKARVVIALGLLVGAKLMNVQVPFFFKYAVDYFNKLPPLTTPEGTIITMGTALLLGCE